MPKSALAGIKQQLEKDGVIAITPGKSGRGQSNFVVNLIKVEENLETSLNVVGGFEAEYQNFHDEPF